MFSMLVDMTEIQWGLCLAGDVMGLLTMSYLNDVYSFTAAQNVYSLLHHIPIKSLYSIDASKCILLVLTIT